MNVDNERSSAHGLRVLTHDELTRRIRSLDLLDDLDGADGEPRWIDAAELVRRVAPWISQN